MRREVIQFGNKQMTPTPKHIKYIHSMPNLSRRTRQANNLFRIHDFMRKTNAKLGSLFVKLKAPAMKSKQIWHKKDKPSPNSPQFQKLGE